MFYPSQPRTTPAPTPSHLPKFASSFDTELAAAPKSTGSNLVFIWHKKKQVFELKGAYSTSARDQLPRSCLFNLFRDLEKSRYSPAMPAHLKLLLFYPMLLSIIFTVFGWKMIVQGLRELGLSGQLFAPLMICFNMSILVNFWLLQRFFYTKRLQKRERIMKKKIRSWNAKYTGSGVSFEVGKFGAYIVLNLNLIPRSKAPQVNIRSSEIEEKGIKRMETAKTSDSTDSSPKTESSGDRKFSFYTKRECPVIYPKESNSPGPNHMF